MMKSGRTFLCLLISSFSDESVPTAPMHFSDSLDLLSTPMSPKAMKLKLDPMLGCEVNVKLLPLPSMVYEYEVSGCSPVKVAWCWCSLKWRLVAGA